jgi:hypothetical protein
MNDLSNKLTKIVSDWRNTDFSIKYSSKNNNFCINRISSIMIKYIVWRKNL